MGWPVKNERKVTMGGQIFHSKPPDTEVDAQQLFRHTLAAAKTGALTTRTSDSVGTITGQSGHGVTDAQRLDLFWKLADGTYGSRYGCLVGTVASLSIPITGGAGDNLPLDETGNTANTNFWFQVPTEQSFTEVGSNVAGIFAKVLTALAATEMAMVTFADGSGNLANMVLRNATNGGVYIWQVADGVTSPLDGDTATKFFVSHNGAAARDIVVGIASN